MPAFIIWGLTNWLPDKLILLGFLLVFLVIYVVLPYVVIVILANVIYRWRTGAFFRWFSRYTLIPLCVLSAIGSFLFWLSLDYLGSFN